jgi:hypothetical protein
MFPATSCPTAFGSNCPKASAGAACFQRVNGADAEDEQHPHDSEKSPSLTFGTDHAPKAVGQGRAEHQDQQQFSKVGQWTGIFEGVGGIDIEEAAAVAAQKLDSFLRRNRPAGDGLRHNQ